MTRYRRVIHEYQVYIITVATKEYTNLIVIIITQVVGILSLGYFLKYKATSTRQSLNKYQKGNGRRHESNPTGYSWVKRFEQKGPTWQQRLWETIGRIKSMAI